MGLKKNTAGLQDPRAFIVKQVELATQDSTAETKAENGDSKKRKAEELGGDAKEAVEKDGSESKSPSVPQAEWECLKCGLTNKPDADNCRACREPKVAPEDAGII